MNKRPRLVIKDIEEGTNYNSETGIYKITIKNVGNKDLFMEDFYSADQLRLCIKYSKINYVFLDQAEEFHYMNANIKDVDDNCIYLGFDAWEPDSTITVSMISFDDVYNRIDILGKTKSFSEIEASDLKSKTLLNEFVPF